MDIDIGCKTAEIFNEGNDGGYVYAEPGTHKNIVVLLDNNAIYPTRHIWPMGKNEDGKISHD